MTRRKDLIRKRFEQALIDRADLDKRLSEITAKRELTQAEASSRAELSSKIMAKDLELSGLRDGYGLYLLESLEHESWTLKWLTIVLIVLTLVLTTFTGYLIGIR